MIRHLKIYFVCAVLLLSLSFSVQADEDKAEILKYVREHITEISNNSDIFFLIDKETGFKNWFELYGILSEVIKRDDVYTAIIDVNEYGLDEEAFLIYVDVKRIDDKLSVTEMRLGQQHDRNLIEPPAPRI